MIPTPDPLTSLSRLANLAPKLGEALADLRRAGGLRGVAKRHVVKPKTIDRTAETLASLRAQLDLELTELTRPAAGPTPRPLLRRQPNRPDPIPTVR
jgi:hypothetical protein